MNRTEAIEQALRNCQPLDLGDHVEIPLEQWEAVDEALALPKDAEPVVKESLTTDAERVALANWQPIETAPKDGSFVDLWISSKVDEGVGQRVTDCFCEHGRWHDGCAFVEDEWYQPTHWMPFPEPPKGGA